MLRLAFRNTITSNWQRLTGQLVYALVFDNNGNALDWSASVPSLKNFDGNHNRFGVTLPEDSVRNEFFSIAVSGSTVSLPDSPYGSPYDVEYWATSATGVMPTFSRPSDMFLGFEKMPWNNALGTNGDGTILQIQSQTNLIPSSPASTQYECFVSFSYDATISLLQFVCWLEADHQFQANAKNCTLKLNDSSGNTLFNGAVAAASGPGPIVGFFAGQLQNITLYPDDNYMGTVTITDVDSVTHTSACSPTTWD